MKKIIIEVFENENYTDTKVSTIGLSDIEVLGILRIAEASVIRDINQNENT